MFVFSVTSIFHPKTVPKNPFCENGPKKPCLRTKFVLAVILKSR